MDIEIIGIKNSGDETQERIRLRVKEDCDLSSFLIIDSTYENDKLTNKCRHVFWFPKKKVMKGQLVLLYTGSGDNRTYRSTSGTTVHQFYWGLDEPVLNDEGDCVGVIEISDWEFKSAE